MNNLDHYNREMKQIAQEAGKRKGVGGGLVAWLMMLVGVVVTGTMTYALTRKGMASSVLWRTWVNFAAFLPTVLLEGSALALVYGRHHWFRSEEQRSVSNAASWVIWGLLAVTSVVHFAFGSTVNPTQCFHTLYFAEAGGRRKARENIGDFAGFIARSWSKETIRKESDARPPTAIRAAWQ
jgi:hypothetical protein